MSPGYYERAALQAYRHLQKVHEEANKRGDLSLSMSKKMHRAVKDLDDFQYKAGSTARVTPQDAAMRRTDYLIASTRARAVHKEYFDQFGGGADALWGTHVQETVEGEKLYNAQIKEKTPAPSAPRSGNVTDRNQVIAKSIKDIKAVQQAGMYGSTELPGLKEVHEGLRARWEILKKKAPSMNQSAFDKMAKKLHADTNKAMGKATSARKAKDFAEQQKGAQSRVDREEKARVKLAAETPAADTPPSNGGVDPKRAEDARASAAEQRAPSTTAPSATPSTATKWNGATGQGTTLSGGQAKAFFNKLSAAEKKQVLDVLDNPDRMPTGGTLRNGIGSIPAIKEKAIAYRESAFKGAIPATTTATTTATATTKKGKGKKGKGKKGKGKGKPATVLDPDAVESAKASAKHVSRRDMKTTLKFVSEKTGRSVADLEKAAEKSPLTRKKYLASLLDAEQLAELNPKPGETKRRAKRKPATTTTPTTAESSAGMGEDKIKKAVKAQQARLAKSPEMRETFATGPTNNPVRQSVLSGLVKEHGQADGRVIYDRLKAAETSAPPPTATSQADTVVDERPKAKPKAKPRAKPAPATYEVDTPEPTPKAKPAPAPTSRADMTPRQKAADTRLQTEKARLARQAKIEADMKAGEPKRKAKAERIKTNKANRKSVAEVFESEGLTPEQAKTKAGREAVDDMRKIQGKKGVLESSKKPLTKLQKAARVAGDVTRANRIPPGVLKGLGTAFRIAGKAAGVYEFGRVTYSISKDGLVKTMRDDDFVTPLVGKLAKATRAPGSGKIPKAVDADTGTTLEDRSKVREISTKSTIPRRPTYTRADAIRREDGGKKAAADAKRDVAMLAQLSKEKDLRGAVKQALMNNPLTGAEEIEKDAKWHKAQDAKIAKVKARQAKRKARRKVAAARKPKVSKSDAVQARIQRVLKRSREEARRKPGKAREAAAPVDASRPRPTRHAWIPTTRPESQAEARSSRASALERMGRARADADVKKAMAGKSIKAAAEKARKEARRSVDRILPPSEMKRLLRDD